MASGGGCVLAAALAGVLASAKRLHPSNTYFDEIHTEDEGEDETGRRLSTKTHSKKQREEEDLVKKLPGLDPSANVTHHAGRIALYGGDKDFLFYWHFEAARDAEKAPLVIWLNGGPGCSSMQGLFTGNSPFMLVNESTIGRNAHSWHQFANMLFVDQPVGTGMSYTSGNDYRSSEEDISADFYDFLIRFVQRHTEYLSNAVDGVKHSRAVYLFGESHAGRWIPEFSEHIMNRNDDADSQIKIRLVGFGIGNGWVHPKIQYEYSDYAHGLGFLSFGQVRSLKASYAKCEAALDAGTYYSESCLGNMNAITNSVKAGNGGNALNHYDVRQYVRNVGAYPPGMKTIAAYLTKLEVREAVHGNKDKRFRFEMCSNGVYQGLKKFDGVSTLDAVQSLLQRGLRMIFYVGQWDMMCNYYGMEKLLLGLNWNGAKAYQQARKFTWQVQGRKEPAGFVQQGGNLTYVVVAGAGHVVPLNVPDVAADLLRRFVNGLDFNDKEQSVTNTRLNATDLEVTFCHAPGAAPATDVSYSTSILSSGSSSQAHIDITWLFVALVIALVSSILTVCATRACLRNGRPRQPDHKIITQDSDGEHIDQPEDDEQKESSDREDVDEHEHLNRMSQ